MTESAWRPIETAPKDRAPILYSGENMPGERRWVTCGRWTPEGWFEINIDDCDAHGKADYPTHWMPLPQPPANDNHTSPASSPEATQQVECTCGSVHVSHPCKIHGVAGWATQQPRSYTDAGALCAKSEEFCPNCDELRSQLKTARELRQRCNHELANTQEIARALMAALEPFAECNRGWVEDGKRAEIRFDWLQHAADALSRAKDAGLVPEQGSALNTPE